MARYRGTTAERGLGTPHINDKKRLLAQHREGDPCWRCGQPMYKAQGLERDHIVDRARGGAEGPAVLAHMACNRSAGARLGNQMQPRVILAAGHDVICATCGKPYHYAPRVCEICGVHYHPSGKTVRTCSRTCGVQLIRRNRIAKGWVPQAQRPKPAPKPRRPGPVQSGEREPKNGWPAVAVAYYTCRYCGTVGVTKADVRQQREVCPARACQLARIGANNLRTRNGLTREDADAQVSVVVRQAIGGSSRQW
jgi:5-methylcytosine-specific restriction endonuclease McrA